VELKDLKKLKTLKPESFAREWLKHPAAPELAFEPLEVVPGLFVPSPFEPLSGALGALVLDAQTLYVKGPAEVQNPAWGYDYAAAKSLPSFALSPYVPLVNASRDPLFDFLTWDAIALPAEEKAVELTELKSPAKAGQREGFAYAAYVYAEGGARLTPLDPLDVMLKAKEPPETFLDELLG